MGNKPIKGDKGSAAAGSAPADTDEYWWGELEKNLRPIKSCEEFCARFNGLCTSLASLLLPAVRVSDCV